MGMRPLLLFLLLAALSRCSPVSEPAAGPDPQPQPVADPEADAHYGHWGYGRAIAPPHCGVLATVITSIIIKDPPCPNPTTAIIDMVSVGTGAGMEGEREPRTPSPSQLQDQCLNQRPMLTTDITAMVDGDTPTMATAGDTTGDEYRTGKNQHDYSSRAFSTPFGKSTYNR